MTDQMQTIRDDIAYLKALAEDGRGEAARGGAIGVAAGLIYAACSVVQWAALTGRVAPLVSNGCWIVGTLLFYAILVVVKRSMAPSAGRGRAIGAASMGLGWAGLTLAFAIGVATWRTQSMVLIYFAPSIVLALYGAAWTLGAALSRRFWVWAMAVGAFVATVVCAYFISDPVQYLIYAAALLLLAALPGALVMRQELRAA